MWPAQSISQKRNTVEDKQVVLERFANTDHGFQLNYWEFKAYSMQNNSSERPNKVQGEYHWWGGIITKEISLYVQIVPWKEKLIRGRLCCPLRRSSKWQSVFQPSNSSCALASDTISSSRTTRLLIPKAVCYKDIFQKKGIFEKERKKQNKKKQKTKNISLHISHTHTYKHRSGCSTRQRTFSVCWIDKDDDDTLSLLNCVSRRKRKTKSRN